MPSPPQTSQVQPSSSVTNTKTIPAKSAEPPSDQDWPPPGPAVERPHPVVHRSRQPHGRSKSTSACTKPGASIISPKSHEKHLQKH
ncbi:hypothetical protein CCHR01_19565 [Colletotrichum chrysophilum]|uniref:Uncharacterized protein n=1 Tax=Colletotrichum chrysophilum TaxID=1836956 RepID=A0AAD9E7R4_9PEZI|nr:hypothetical protein CCHR01_19565 [Colletotrichum chrysophilum]